MKRLLQIINLLILGAISYAQSPVVNCLNVAPNGNVTINWTPSTNMSSVFVQYNIYSNSSGSFAQEGVINNVNSSVYVHAGAGANVSSVSYFVTVVYNNGMTDIEMPALDTLSTIFLGVSNPNDGTAVLQWSDLADPTSSDNGDYFYIYREIVPNGWGLYDSVLIDEVNYYRDTISVCSANINYQIALNNIAGCQSTSNIDGELFQDLIPPASPVLNSVTIDTTTGDAILSWDPSTSGDASAYIILQNVGGIWGIIDTVYGYNNTTYYNSNSNGDIISEMYGIAAFDSCWNGNPPAPNTSPMGTPHKSIFVKNSYDVCSLEVYLSWNTYKDWNSGVAKYEVYRSVEGGVYSLEQTNGATDSSYTDRELDYGLNYCYLIKGISGDFQDTVFSNITCRLTNQAPTPTYAYLSNVSVEDNLIEVSIYPDLTGITREIELQRSTDQGVTFETVLVETNVAGTIVYEDEEINPKEEYVFYRYIVRDSCMNEVLVSNVSNNIILSVTNEEDELTNFLQWKGYRNWNGTIDSYEIYRSINGVFESTPLVILPNSQLYYEDDISDLLGTDANGNFCYRVEAKESINVFGFSKTAKSNQACATQNSLVYIPNALVASGYNSTWKPVVNLIDFDSYEVNIYNRLGQLIFKSNEYDASWDGRYKGGAVQQGVYVSQVSFTDGSGKPYEFWGTITVIR